ncbi:hypothetical protein C6P11_10855 [Weissella confusa]|uniref:Uncharacterized protein n=2 Tax=Weissella confusa TaxID=1583 RepID=A0A4Z0RWC5_WEICO|nr:hypothetical protein C6P11_10855 [Weissella confusa]
MLQSKVSRKAALFITGFFVIFPYFNMLAITLVKDALFSYSFSFVLIAVVNMFLKKKVTYLDLVILFFGNVGTLFFRHNGFPILLASELIFVFVFYGKTFWKTHAVMILSLIIYLVVSGPVFNSFNVIPAPKNEDTGMLIQMDAAILIDENSKISEIDKRYFSTVFDSSRIAELYNPYSPDALKFSSAFTYDSDKLRFISKSARLILGNPLTAFKAYANQASMLWKINSVQGLRPFFRQPYKLGKPYYFAEVDVIKKITWITKNLSTVNTEMIKLTCG